MKSLPKFRNKQLNANVDLQNNERDQFVVTLQTYFNLFFLIKILVFLLQ